VGHIEGFADSLGTVNGAEHFEAVPFNGHGFGFPIGFGDVEPDGLNIVEGVFFIDGGIGIECDVIWGGWVVGCPARFCWVESKDNAAAGSDGFGA